MPPYATLAGIVLALALGFAGGWGAHGWRSGARLADLRAEVAANRQAQAESAQLRERAARSEEQRRAAAQQEITDAATLRARVRETDRSAADAAGGGLRVRAAEFAASAGSGAVDTGAAAQCAAASDAARVLAELLGRVESAGRRMAAIADERGDAGQACERSYEALSKR
jgi:hypothetical protein